MICIEYEAMEMYRWAFFLGKRRIAKSCLFIVADSPQMTIELIAKASILRHNWLVKDRVRKSGTKVYRFKLIDSNNKCLLESTREYLSLSKCRFIKERLKHEIVSKYNDLELFIESN